jgi:hypothetical protein
VNLDEIMMSIVFALLHTGFELIYIILEMRAYQTDL